MGLAELLYQALGGALPLRLELYDGSTAGPADAKVRMIVRSEQGLARFLSRPGELGIARAYVSGDVDIDGDLFAGLEQAAHLDLSLRRIDPVAVARLLRATGLGVLRAPPPPPEEARLRGGLHTRSRDRAAISHHYDVSNDFYRLVLGPVDGLLVRRLGRRPESALEEAQAAKLELICRKLGLAPGHAPARRGLRLGRHGDARRAPPRRARPSASPSRPSRPRSPGERVSEAGLADRVEIRLQDYRDVARRPVRRHQLDRHVRARRPQPHGGVRPRPPPPAAPRRAGCSTTPSAAPATPRATAGSVAPRRSTAASPPRSAPTSPAASTAS